MPDVYSIEGSTTTPFTFGFMTSNAASDIAQTKNKVASASCAPLNDCVRIQVVSAIERTLTWAHTVQKPTGQRLSDDLTE